MGFKDEKNEFNDKQIMIIYSINIYINWFKYSDEF